MDYRTRLSREEHRHIRQLKSARIQQTGSTCERCKQFWPSNELQLHHLTYVNLGHETDADVELLCHECHRLADRERERAHPQFEARLRAWSMKAYSNDGTDGPYRRIDLEEKYFRAKESGKYPRRWTVR